MSLAVGPTPLLTRRPVIVDRSSFIREALLWEDRSRILVLAYHLLSEFLEFGGELTYYGATPPGGPVKAGRLTSHVRPVDAELLELLEKHTREGVETPYRIIYVDFHRAPGRLAQQINALLRWSDAETVFIFPGAVPPDPDMTGPTPQHPWWMGETWLLPQVLEPAGPGFRTLTALLPPMGVLLARDFKPIESERLIEASARALLDRLDIKSFQASFRHAPMADFLEALGASDQEARRAPTEAGVVEVVIDESAPDIAASEVLDPYTTWVRRDPDFILDLSGRALDTSVLHHGVRWRQANQIDRFQNVEVLGPDVMLAGGPEAGGRRFYCKNAWPDIALRNLREAVRNSHGFASGRIREVEGAFSFSAKLLEGAVPLDRPVFFATPDEPLNWGLWLLYNVPAAHHFERYRSDYPDFFCYMDQPWQRKLLLTLGLPEEALLPQRLEQIYAVRELATYRQSFRGMVIRDSDREAFAQVTDRFGAADKRASPEKIYISRLGLDYHRVLTNERELAAALEARGFTVVSPQDLPFSEQVRLFHNARVIVGLGGAGLFNVVFARPGVRLITIESGMTWVDAHANLFASCGAEYGIILGAQDESDPTPDQKRWSVDLPKTLAAIDQFIG